ncbi:MAG: Holliday junction branch migration protein RuvA [Dehalococcoidia bacterium]
MSILARLRGTIAEKSLDSVILFAGGLGFEIQAPLSTVSALPAVGEEVTLRTYLHIREGALGLFGFLTQEEQRMFELLLTVTGVGPKAALNCLSLLKPEAISGAIASGDTAILRRVRGLGAKTVDRIIVELKGRTKDLPQQQPASGGGDSVVLDALMSFGYSAAEATAAMASLPKDGVQSPEEQVRLAFQYFAPKNETRGRDR